MCGHFTLPHNKGTGVPIVVASMLITANLTQPYLERKFTQLIIQEKVVEKLVQDGKVAVLHSKDWGTPWATWYPETMFDSKLIQLFLKWQSHPLNSLEEFMAADRAYYYLHVKYPDVVFRGLEGLTVTWLPEGQEFIIREYDGVEILVLKEEIKWIKA